VDCFAVHHIGAHGTSFRKCEVAVWKKQVMALERKPIRGVETVLLILYLYIRNTKTTATKLRFLGKNVRLFCLSTSFEVTPPFSM
jgi:hypothetical protein